MKVFIITAETCGACTRIKEAGIYDKIVNTLESKGAKVYKINLKTMSSEYSSQGDEGYKFKHMDSIITQYFRRWFPTFVAMTNNAFEAIEYGTLTTITDIDSVVDIYNGILNKDAKMFDIIDRNKGISEAAIYDWFDRVKANGKKYSPPQIAKPMLDRTRSVTSNVQHQANGLPLMNTDAVVRTPASKQITSERNGPMNLGHIPETVQSVVPGYCSQRPNMSIKPRYG